MGEWGCWRNALVALLIISAVQGFEFQPNGQWRQRPDLDVDLWNHISQNIQRGGSSFALNPNTIGLGTDYYDNMATFGRNVYIVDNLGEGVHVLYREDSGNYSYVQNVTADVPERNNRGQRDPPITAEFNLPIIMPIVVTPDGANVILSSAFQSHPWIVNAKRDPVRGNLTVQEVIDTFALSGDEVFYNGVASSSLVVSDNGSLVFLAVGPAVTFGAVPDNQIYVFRRNATNYMNLVYLERRVPPVAAMVGYTVDDEYQVMIGSIPGTERSDGQVYTDSASLFVWVVNLTNFATHSLRETKIPCRRDPDIEKIQDWPCYFSALRLDASDANNKTLYVASREAVGSMQPNEMMVVDVIRNDTTSPVPYLQIRQSFTALVASSMATYLNPPLDTPQTDMSATTIKGICVTDDFVIVSVMLYRQTEGAGFFNPFPPNEQTGGVLTDRGGLSRLSFSPFSGTTLMDGGAAVLFYRRDEQGGLSARPQRISGRLRPQEMLCPPPVPGLPRRVYVEGPYGLEAMVFEPAPLGEIHYLPTTRVFSKGTFFSLKPSPRTESSQYSSGTPVAYYIRPELPRGVVLNKATGEISGTPLETRAGQMYSVTAWAPGSNTVIAMHFTFNEGSSFCSYGPVTPRFVLELDRPVTISGPNVTNGTEYSFNVRPALPFGLTFDHSTGAISGTPSFAVEEQAFKVSCHTTNGTTEQTFFMAVTDFPTAFRYDVKDATYTANVTIDPNYPQNLGTAPQSYSVAPPLPAGIVFDDKRGVIAGRPVGEFARSQFSITAKLTTGQITHTNITIAVVAHPPTTLHYDTTLVHLAANLPMTPNTATVSGGPVALFTVFPNLPSGLTLNPTTGTITGTATAKFDLTGFRITASNTGGSVSTTVYMVATLVQKELLPLPYKFMSAVYTVGETIDPNFALVTGLAGYTWKVEPALPDGLTLNSITGQITGTPTTATEAAAYTVSTTDADGLITSTTSLYISVLPVPPKQILYSFNDQPAPAATFQVQYFLNQNITDLSGTRLLIPSATVSPPAALQTPGTSFRIAPNLPNGLTLNASGSIVGIPTQLRPLTTFAVTFTNNAGSVTTALKLEVKDSQLTQVNYTQKPFTGLTIGARVSIGPPITSPSTSTVRSFSVTPTLPEGLLINSLTGEIFGVALSASPAKQYTVSATNTAGSVTEAITIGVQALVSVPEALFYRQLDSVYVVGVPIEPNTVVIGVAPPYRLDSSTPLPAGLSFNTADGTISGTPTAITARRNVTIISANDRLAIFITVLPEPPATPRYSVNPWVLQRGPGRVSNGASSVGADSWTVFPSLPLGLQLNASTGEISGIPTEIRAQGVYTVTARNSGGASSVQLLLTVNDAPPILETDLGALFLRIGENITVITPENTGGAALWWTLRPNPPFNITFNPATGEIGGRAEQAAPRQLYRLKAFNSGGSATTFITISVDSFGIAPANTEETIPNEQFVGQETAFASLAFLFLFMVVGFIMFLSWRARKKKTVYDTAEDALNWVAFQEALADEEMKAKAKLKRKERRAKVELHAVVPKSISKLFQRLKIPSQFASQFEANEILVADLPHLTESEMRDMVPSLRERKKLMAWIYGTLIPHLAEVKDRPWVTNPANSTLPVDDSLLEAHSTNNGSTRTNGSTRR